jgi:hypothetical protein
MGPEKLLIFGLPTFSCHEDGWKCSSRFWRFENVKIHVPKEAREIKPELLACMVYCTERKLPAVSALTKTRSALAWAYPRGTCFLFLWKVEDLQATDPPVTSKYKNKASGSHSNQKHSFPALRC